MNYILGIDPGLKGAICLYRPETKEVINLWDMPLIDSSASKKMVISPYQLWRVLIPCAFAVKFAVVEKVHSMPGQSSVSTFSFGKSVGTLLGVLGSLPVEVKEVSPAVWKSRLNLSKDKIDSRIMASRLFPSFSEEFKRKKDDGRAEAALLALYGSLYLDG